MNMHTWTGAVIRLYFSFVLFFGLFFFFCFSWSYLLRFLISFVSTHDYEHAELTYARFLFFWTLFLMSFRLWFPLSARLVSFRFLMCICLNASRRLIIENAYILMMKLFIMVGLSLFGLSI